MRIFASELDALDYRRSTSLGTWGGGGVGSLGLVTCVGIGTPIRLKAKVENRLQMRRTQKPLEIPLNGRGIQGVFVSRIRIDLFHTIQILTRNLAKLDKFVNISSTRERT